MPEVKLVMQCPINVILYHKVKWRAHYFRGEKRPTWVEMTFFCYIYVLYFFSLCLCHSLISLNVVRKSNFLINHKYFNPILRNGSSEINVKPNIKWKNMKGYGTCIPLLIKVIAGFKQKHFKRVALVTTLFIGSLLRNL